MGGVFSRALLRSGETVVPALRDTSLERLATSIPEPRLVLVTVAEDDLDPALGSVPDPWKTRIGLVQNELLPRNWERHAITQPTVASVWF